MSFRMSLAEPWVRGLNAPIIYMRPPSPLLHCRRSTLHGNGFQLADLKHATEAREALARTNLDSNGHRPFGGSKCLPGWFLAMRWRKTYQIKWVFLCGTKCIISSENLNSNWHLFVLRGVLRLASMIWNLCTGKDWRN